MIIGVGGEASIYEMKLERMFMLAHHSENNRVHSIYLNALIRIVT